VGALDLRRMLLTKLHKKRLPFVQKNSRLEIEIEISVLPFSTRVRKEQLKLPLMIDAINDPVNDSTAGCTGIGR
jgi:hypothetical protein